MARLTQSEIEEAKYEIWRMSGGPAKAQQKHLELATASLPKIQNAGWKILSSEMKKQFMVEFETMELVIRKGDTVAILEWHTFNKGWMIKLPSGGSSIFHVA